MSDEGLFQPIGERRGPRAVVSTMASDTSAARDHVIAEALGLGARRMPQDVLPSERMRARRGKNQHDLHASHARLEVTPDTVGEVREPAKRTKRDGIPVLTDEEAKQRVSGLARKFMRLAAQSGTPRDMKNHVTSAAILLDKYLLLSNRPTTIVGMTTFTEENRAAVRSLGARLLQVVDRKAEG